MEKNDIQVGPIQAELMAHTGLEPRPCFNGSSNVTSCSKFLLGGYRRKDYEK